MDIHQKKQKNVTQLEYLEGEVGDAWIWIAFDPINKIAVAFVVGKRTLSKAEDLVHGVHEISPDELPFFTSDELDHYTAAIREEYGKEKVFEKTGKRGRPRKPIKEVPQELVYAQVKKTREKGKVVKIEKQIVFGTEKTSLEKIQQSPVSNTINTSFVERNNLTLRQNISRLTRKTLKFSKKKELLKDHLHLFLGFYHFIRPHMGLIKRSKNTTPMMAAGITDHPWSFEELFLLQLRNIKKE